MFLDLLRRRNGDFLNAVARLHQRRELPANSLVLDLEAVGRNAERIAAKSKSLGLEVFAMTKQVGRNPDFAAALLANGISSAVAVDIDCARACAGAGLSIGNIGHLVQVPAAEAEAASSLRPANWTVFSVEKAREASDAAKSQNRLQDLLLRVYDEGDKFYPGHEGGFHVDALPEVLSKLAQIDGVRVAGVTTFPALLYDEGSGRVELTPNVRTLQKARVHLESAGIGNVRVNAPGTTSSEVLALLAEAGATQVEPGHGLTGTTPLHAREDLPEEPAAAYLTEVSHHHGGQAFFFGGGLYVDPVISSYQPRALVFPPGGHDPVLLPASLPPAAMIDYYGQLEGADQSLAPPGSTVILGFRFQAFVTRAHVVGIDNVARGGRVRRICTSSGDEQSWP